MIVQLKMPTICFFRGGCQQRSRAVLMQRDPLFLRWKICKVNELRKAGQLHLSPDLIAYIIEVFDGCFQASTNILHQL